MTLKVTSIQNAAGTRTYALCKAALRFGSASDNIVINNSHNITSVNWLAQGYFQVNFESGTFSDGKYAIVTSVSADLTGRDPNLALHQTNADIEVAPTASSMQFTVFDLSENDEDPASEMSLLFFR
jgi:hypothetical protein